MPLYTWHCEKCEHDIEVVRSLADWELPPAKDDGTPTCKTPRTKHKWARRIPAGSGTFHLVGYGWARDRYEK